MSERWRMRTRLVHGGAARSAFGETSEAIFLTSGFVYASAEEAEARVADREPGYQYSRIANPTVRMLEERFARLEGSEDCAAVATGMAAVHAALFCQLRAGARLVASAQAPISVGAETNIQDNVSVVLGAFASSLRANSSPRP